MAEAVVNHLFRVPPVCTACDMSRVLSTPSVRATSAGLYGAGDPIAENAVRALREAAGNTFLIAFLARIRSGW